LPIRWRLAGGSAALTFIILAAFAALVGVFTAGEVRGSFNNNVHATTEQLARQLRLGWLPNGELDCRNTTIDLSDFTSAEHAQIRIFSDGGVLLCTQDQVLPKRAPHAAVPAPDFPPPDHSGTYTELGYRVVVRALGVQPSGTVWLTYARPLSDLDHTIARVQFFLLLGVLGGTFLALLAGLTTAQRAIRPIKELTEAASEIERTRDPSRHVPLPQADDEVAELARTLEGMLQSLDAARSGTEAMLDRQREFVADASHELRTPLTSVLASLELLAEELDGEPAETAQAALRSARRMRRLVADLLLLARADAKRTRPATPTDLASVLMEAASEIGAVAEDHDLQIDPEPAVVPGVRDDLHRMVLNLLENAVEHTPPGTHIWAGTETVNGHVTLTVQDDGPGIPEELMPRVFERFVRSGRDGVRGSGLGLSIVRAVADSHGGSVELDSGTAPGARFVIRLPSGSLGAGSDGPDDPAERELQTSTTTGSTIGRRRSRS
jgi:signal transduction histidine kinase